MAHAQDADGDGVAGAEYGGADCDDQDAAVYPAASEICDDVDQDCDGSVDEWQEFAIWFPDLDGDGFGDDSGALEACRVLPDHVVTGGDCSDLDASVFPSAAEVCDGVEQNCNELVDEGLDTALWYRTAMVTATGSTVGRSRPVLLPMATFRRLETVTTSKPRRIVVAARSTRTGSTTTAVGMLRSVGCWGSMG